MITLAARATLEKQSCGDLLAIFQSIATMEEGGEGDTPAPTSQNNQEVLPGAYVSADLTASVNARPTPKPCFKRIHSLEIPDLEYENRGSTEDQEEFINVINSELSETINIDVCGRNEGFRYDCFTPAESSHPGELDELFAGPSLLDDTLLTYPATSSTPLTNRVSGPVPSLRQSKGRVSRKQQIQGLRETVTELTRQRDDLQLMASTSSLEVSDPSSPASCSASQRVASLLAKPQSIWEHIAAQQLVIRQNSEEENARLRDLIDQQKQQARNFRRMIRRRRDEELLDDHLSKRPKIRHNEEIFDELLQGLDDLYVDLDKLFTEKNMAGVPCPGREHQVYPNAAEGAEFVEFLDKNRVPFDFHRAENAVWAFLQSSRVCERQNGQHKICATELKQSSCTSKSSAAFTYFEKGLTSYVSEQRVARKYTEENRTVFISRTLAEPTTCQSWSAGIRFIETMSVVVRRGDDMASGQETAVIESLISVSRCAKGDQGAKQCQWPAYVDTAAKGWGRKVSFNSQEIENLLLDMSIGQGKC